MIGAKWWVLDEIVNMSNSMESTSFIWENFATKYFEIKKFQNFCHVIGRIAHKMRNTILKNCNLHLDT